MSETVEIGGRVFRVGATYRPRKAWAPYAGHVRTFVGLEPCQGYSTSWAVYRTRAGQKRRTWAEDFARWAGEELPAPVEGERS